MDKNSLNNQSFNDTELSNGYHLLTESSHNVKVNVPPVPTSTAHLHPRLAGSNWTCYLSQPNVILGRSNMAKTTEEKKKHVVHVDFGGSKAISRKHCEIRFSAKRDRWELYVYGRNGVKLNHVMKKPRDKPVVLTTGALIEISNTRFVFILPNNYLKPNCGSTLTLSQKTSTDTDSEVNTPVNEDIILDNNMERAIAGLLVKHTSLYTFEIYEELKNSYDKTIEKNNVLYTLVLSPIFRLTSSSVSMSAKESDLVKWMLKNRSATIKDLPMSPKPVTEIPNSPSLTNFLNDDDNQWSVFDQCDGPEEKLEWDEEVDELDEDEENGGASPSIVPPPLFHGLSTESIYSVWTSSASLNLGSSFEENIHNQEPPPSKRLKHVSSGNSESSNESNEKFHKEKPSVDIYHQVRTTIMF